MKQYPFAAARVFGCPLLIHPAKGKVIAQALAGRLSYTHVEFHEAGGAKPMAFDDDWGEDDFSSAGDSPEGWDLVEGVGIVPVEGTLVHKSSSLRPYSGMLGYNAIAHNFAEALVDERVRAIVLACDSPGGEVSGCFDLVDMIYAARGTKPIVAICDDMAFSACYAIASAADRIYVPRTGGTGSIGVVAMHCDWSKAVKGMGLEISIFQYGARKADGNEFMPLSKEARQRFQADIDELGGLFVETVARNLGVSAAKVKATEAATYMGAAGVDAGLADAVMAPTEAFRSLLDELG